MEVFLSFASGMVRLSTKRIVCAVFLPHRLGDDLEELKPHAKVPAYLKLDPPCRNECRIWDTDFIHKNLSFEQYFSIVQL